uniref:Uncharacterized protein n=1 Tax=Salmo trutta TaxID=8032 RepID=A0A674DXA1_SALTR
EWSEPRPHEWSEPVRDLMVLCHHLVNRPCAVGCVDQLIDRCRTVRTTNDTRSPGVDAHQRFIVGSILIMVIVIGLVYGPALTLTQHIFSSPIFPHSPSLFPSLPLFCCMPSITLRGFIDFLSMVKCY